MKRKPVCTRNESSNGMSCDVQTVRKCDQKCDAPCLQDSVRLPLVICKTKERSRIIVTLFCGNFLLKLETLQNGHALLSKFFNLVIITVGKCP